MTPVAGVRRRSLVFYVATTDLMGSSGADEFSSADEDEADLTEGLSGRQVVLVFAWTGVFSCGTMP